MTQDVQGFVAPGFEPVAEAFGAALAAGVELGAGFAAQIEGETVVELWGGWADRARTRPWARDTLVPVFSTTKPIAALTIARAMDAGRLSLETPIAGLWPAFAAHGKGAVTVGQGLSHQAGVPGFPDPIDPGLWLDPPALGAALAALAPMWQPGTANGYHPLTYGYIAGEIARRADPTGRTLGVQLQEDVCGPAGVDFRIGLPDVEHPRCAELARPKEAPDLGPITPEKRAAFLTPWAAPNRGTAEWRRAEIPSANGHGTAATTAALYSVYANDGRLGGRAVVSADTLAAFTQVQIAGPDRVLPFDLTWAAGIMVNTNRVYGPNPQAFGHSGWGGSCGLADPDRRLSAAYVMNRQSNALMGDPRATALIGALYGCL